MQKQSKFVSFLLLDVFETYWVFSFWVMDHFWWVNGLQGWSLYLKRMKMSNVFEMGLFFEFLNQLKDFIVIAVVVIGQ